MKTQCKHCLGPSTGAFKTFPITKTWQNNFPSYSLFFQSK